MASSVFQFFFFKQKTAYEITRCWSSDVCSSDLRIARVLLPMGTFAETSGTYVNCEGLWQSHPGAAAPVGEARPGWKVLRVLGNLLGLEGFDYQSRSEERRVGTEGSARAVHSRRG